jgi:hypothetical protein
MKQWVESAMTGKGLRWVGHERLLVAQDRMAVNARRPAFARQQEER